MPRNDDSLHRLRAAIDDLAAADAADLLTEARIEARARVRATLTDALTHSMLERLYEQLPEPARDNAPARQERPARAPARPERPAPAQARREPRRGLGGPSSSEPAWYVYGVVSGETELTGSLDGVHGAHSVTVLREGALAAVSSQVPLEEFDEAQLREHLADMAWVEATARAHEAVLDAVCNQTTVVPMRMCTVYRTEGGIREMLAREAVPLRDALDHLDGKSEWGVKVFTTLASDGGADDVAGTGDASGVAYMERRRTERERRQRALQMAEEAAGLIHERLSAVASDAQVISLQRPEVSGHSGDMIHNGVYLVSHDDVDAFHEEVRALSSELESHGVELEPTGPWPAYNFVPGTIGAAW